MPTADISGIRYSYVDEGSGPLIVFGHGLLASSEMFRAQIDALKHRYRCVSVDWPGHGDTSWRESWTFWDLADDALALVRHLGEQRAIFAGLSQGGFAFMRLAMAHPDAVERLILLDSSAGPEDPGHLEAFEQLALAIRDGDGAKRQQTALVVATILYGPTWREQEPEALAHEIELMLSHPRDGLYAACRAVFDRDDVTARLGEIESPTLVICGEDDAATPPDRSQALAAGIAGAELVILPRTGHHSAIESPAAVTAAIEGFLQPS